MAVLNIDVPLFKKMVTNGAINLKNNHQQVDELNVFPVPDGDTGTNMQMTVMSGVREMNDCHSTSIVDVSKALSRGCLMGARGNSGVILSQFFRGLHVCIAELNKETLDINDFLKALVSGYKVAYKAVMEPVEGTILTVVREAAQKCEETGSYKNMKELIDDYLKQARIALENTPNLLPVLKEAGVVDSGGAGFIKIVEGMVMALEGIVLEVKDANQDRSKTVASSYDADIKYGYCTEFILDLKHPKTFQERDLKSRLSLLGDSLVCVQDDNICKIHVHTNTPGQALEVAQEYGEFVTIKIENMRLQHSELKDGAGKKVAKPKQKFALIAVCAGSGISETFKSLGVDYVIEGGQTMNPPTEEFVKAVQTVNAENVIIIPNNGNVVMAAEQAIPLCEDVNVRVLKAKTIPQGYASLMVYDQNEDIDTNLEEMTNAVKHVNSGELTYSIRDTEIEGVKINQGDYIGIANGKIVVSTKDRKEACKGMLENLVEDESEIVTVFYGNDVTKEDAAKLQDLIHEINENVDVELIEGKQDIYSFIIAVE